MKSSVIIATAPDDTLLDGVRILLVDLTPEQGQIITECLRQIDYKGRIVLYSWNTEDPIEWLLDKKVKSNLIIFNANSPADLIIGHIASQSNSYYFGDLKSLSKANNNAIYDLAQCKELISHYI